MRLPDRVYDVLKWVCAIVIPALCVLLEALGGVWGVDVSMIVGTIAAIGTFLGALLGISCYQYNKEGE